LATALLLGRREGVDPETTDAFTRTGTTHLLAISGAHLQVLAALLWFFFRMLGMERRRSYLLVSLATVSYALLVGLAPSVVRSAAMTVMVCTGASLDRRARMANVLALAAVVVAALNPAHVFDVGCQLSFVAVGAIVWGVAPADRLRRKLWRILKQKLGRADDPLAALERRFAPWWRTIIWRALEALVEGVTVSVVAWLVALPLVALRFHIVSPIGILLNIPLIPLTSLALLCAGLTLGLSAVWGPLSVPSGWACAWLLELTERIVRWGAAQSWGHVFVAGPPWEWVLIFYIALPLAALAAAARSPWRRWAWAALGGCSALGFALAIQPLRPGALEAEVLSVGHGLAVIIQAPDGRATLYDCGRMGDPSVGRRMIAPALWSRRVHHLDAVVLSHADADHYNGLPDLLERFSIGAVCVPPGFDRPTNPGAVKLLRAARARGIRVQTLAAGDRWAARDGVSFSVLHPPSSWDTASPDNDRSIALDVGFEHHHFLLTGDLELDGLAALASGPQRRWDAVLASHHGGRTASPAWFFDWAKPDLVVVSQRRPAAGARDYLAFLKSRGVPLLSTWQHGALQLRWGAEGIHVRGFLDAADKRACSLASLIASTSTASGQWIVGALAFALGLLLSFVLLVVEWGAWIIVRPGRKFVVVKPEPPPWEPLEIAATDGTRLRGVWRRGEAAGQCAVVHHGFAEDRSAVRDRALALARAGWTVLLPDARGHGESDGDHTSFGAREAGDLKLWIDHVSERLGVPCTWAAWGRSMGSGVVLRAAVDDPRIRALVLEAPYPDLRSAVAAGLRRYRIPGALAALIVSRAARIAGVPLGRPRPLDLAPEVRVPVLLLHGTLDHVVPPAQVRKLADAFPHTAEVFEVAGAKHVDLVKVGGTELFAKVNTFLEPLSQAAQSAIDSRKF
jgi:competence protein ComEC